MEESKKFLNAYRQQKLTVRIFWGMIAFAIAIAIYAIWLIMTSPKENLLPLYIMLFMPALCITISSAMLIGAIRERMRLKALVERWQKIESGNIPEETEKLYRVYLANLCVADIVQSELSQITEKVKLLQMCRNGLLRKTMDMKKELENNK